MTDWSYIVCLCLSSGEVKTDVSRSDIILAGLLGNVVWYLPNMHIYVCFWLNLVKVLKLVGRQHPPPPTTLFLFYTTIFSLWFVTICMCLCVCVYICVSLYVCVCAFSKYNVLLACILIFLLLVSNKICGSIFTHNSWFVLNKE